MIRKCPGQDDRKINAEEIRCPDCGYEAEIFSDELKVKCPGCKGLICRALLPSCIDWCKHARECLGGVRWRKIRGR
ncbi:MAG: phosphohydrolase [Candidatus Omnitrophica bacterium]|nr:phosphohydrolase [Candidatus Omnitrophota bacterium]